MDFRILNHETFEAAKQRMQAMPYKKYFVHSDMLRGFQLKVTPFSSDGLIAAHIQTIQELTHGADIWFPTFALDFPKTKVFDVQDTGSEMGYISEYFRTHFARWRSHVPMHSCCGTGLCPIEINMDPADPWEQNGVFGKLVVEKGAVLFYGAGLEAVSLIHYLEKQCHVPYRYEKIFSGEIINENHSRSGIRVSHIVRPAAYDVAYDWHKLSAELMEHNLLVDLGDKRSRLFVLDAAGTFEFWSTQLLKDPFYLIDSSTKEWALPLYHKLGRPFNISDFEK
jgi:aminoglycoside N3'-acetyltransferase